MAICKSNHECIILWINVVEQVLFSIVNLEIHALAWFGKRLVDCADVVVDVRLFVPKHSKEIVYLVLIELHLIAPLTVVVKLTNVLDAARCSSPKNTQECTRIQQLIPYSRWETSAFQTASLSATSCLRS